MSYSEVCPQPVRRAVMKQGWYDLAYIHFRYSFDEVARILPDGLEVDVCDGSAQCYWQLRLAARCFCLYRCIRKWRRIQLPKLVGD